jgi:hypothetical protein
VFEGWFGVPGIVLAGVGVLVKGTEGVVGGNRPETGGTGAGGSKIPSSKSSFEQCIQYGLKNISA